VRRNASEVYWRAQKCLAHAFAFRCEVIAYAISLLVQHRFKCFALVGKAGRKDAAILKFFAAQKELFVDQIELVAASNIENEVDIPAKNVGELHYL